MILRKTVTALKSRKGKTSGWGGGELFP